MRLDKFICNSTELNREQARELIKQGAVWVNSLPVTQEARQVHEDNEITLDGKRLSLRPARYIMLNKPADTLCSHIDGVYPSLFHLLELDRACDLHLVGRLDADTTGLVLLTDDGRWSFNIMSPQYRCEKVYRVDLRDPLTTEALGDIEAKFAMGLQLQGEKTPTLPATLIQTGPNRVLLTITEGRFHQVKRMFAAVGNRVTALHRLQIGDLRLDMAPGQWRHLTAAELAAF